MARVLFLVTLLLLDHTISALPSESNMTYRDDSGRICLLCPSGHFQSTCTECSPCPTGHYTADWNSEGSCLPCFLDCRDEFHLEVAQLCTSTSDVKCQCKAGYECQRFAASRDNCESCVVQSTVAVMTQALTSCGPSKFLNASSGNCEPHTNCEALGLSVLTAGNSSHNAVCHKTLPSDVGKDWKGIPFAVLVFGITACSAVVLLIWNLRNGAYLKRFVKFCANDGQKEEQHSTTPQRTGKVGQILSKEAQCSKNPLTNPNQNGFMDPPLSMEQTPQATGNLGPFHIYSPGTVFVSLLNQMTGLERQGDGEKQGQEVERGGLSPLPPPSPPVHLSEEERDGRKDFLFFPSQEQGKETHLSKEERM